MTRHVASERRSKEERLKAPLSWRILRRLLQRLWPYRWLIVLSNSLLIGYIWADVTIVHEIKKLIDHPDLHTAPLIPLLLPLFLLCVMHRACGTSQWFVLSRSTLCVLTRLRRDFFIKLQSLSKSFFDDHKVGWLVARNTGDMIIIHEFVTFVMIMTVIFVFSTGMAMARLIAISPWVLIPTLTTAPLMLGLSIWFKRGMSRAQRESRERNSQLVANMAETVKGIRVVHAFAREELNMKQFNALNLDYHDCAIRISHLKAIYMPSLDFLGMLSIVLSTGFGVFLMQSPWAAARGIVLSPGDLVGCILYMQMILWPVRWMVEMYSLSLSAMAAAERIFEIIDTKSEIVNAPRIATDTRLSGSIELDNISFKYNDEGPWILKELSLSIPAGETIALVGETGAGKSTIANLVARFYDVQEGVVRIDGHPIRDYDLDHLHHNTAFVLQEGFLFSGTIMDNLSFGCASVSPEHIRATARQLNTHEFIESLPQGYDTVIQEGGKNLSQGQRQIISLTRALAPDPRILILDEPTSALDVYSERIIQRALEQVMHQRTSIIIAHRLSTVQRADRILVVGDQTILESGTHDQLLARKGHYHKLVSRSNEFWDTEG